MTFPVLRKALLATILIFSATSIPTTAQELMALAAPTRMEEQRPVILPPFFRDSRLLLFPRLFLFHRDNYDRSRRTAWAGGGALSYKSGYLQERLSFPNPRWLENGKRGYKIKFRDSSSKFQVSRKYKNGELLSGPLCQYS